MSDQQIDFFNGCTQCLQSIKTTRTWYEKLKDSNVRTTTESETATTSCTMQYLAVSRPHSHAVSAAARQSRFTSLKSRRTMRLFRTIRDTWQSLLKVYHRFVELISEDDVEIYPNEDYDED